MKTIYTENAPAAIGPYSQAMISGGFVFTSGQIPVDPKSGNVVEGNVSTQAEQVMANIGAVLAAAGSGYDKVIKATCFLASMDDFTDFNAVYGKYMTNKPARSCVAVKTLPKNVLCEVEVVAEV